MSSYIVMCRVSGGVTGTREAPMKRDGAVRYFADRDSAQAEADRAMQTYNGNPYRTADYRYWVEEA